MCKPSPKDLCLHNYNNDPERYGFTRNGQVRVADCEPGTIANIKGEIRRIERVTPTIQDGRVIAYQTPEQGWGTFDEVRLPTNEQVLTFTLTEIAPQGHIYISHSGHRRCFDHLGHYGQADVLSCPQGFHGRWFTPLDIWHVATAEENAEFFAETNYSLTCETCDQPPVSVYVTR